MTDIQKRKTLGHILYLLMNLFIYLLNLLFSKCCPPQAITWYLYRSRPKINKTQQYKYKLKTNKKKQDYIKKHGTNEQKVMPHTSW
uniref:Putative secreted protein n=1 Tax=Ixodes ricinus TaxID=34613 RepID=A0A6B0U7Z3_IXORI